MKLGIHKSKKNRNNQVGNKLVQSLQSQKIKLGFANQKTKKEGGEDKARTALQRTTKVNLTILDQAEKPCFPYVC